MNIILSFGTLKEVEAKAYLASLSKVLVSYKRHRERITVVTTDVGELVLPVILNGETLMLTVNELTNRHDELTTVLMGLANIKDRRSNSNREDSESYDLK